MKKGKYLLIGVFAVLLCASLLGNVYLVQVNRRVKNSIVYSLSDDYLLNQIIITKNTKENERKAFEAADLPGIDINLYEIDRNIEDTQVLTNVPKINQLPDYPNGCEAASATMLLNYFDVNITLKEFIEDYLPTMEIYSKDGSRFGPDPSLFYAGDPASKENGWGCYEPVIENTLNRILFDKKIGYLYVQNLNQKPIKELFYDYPVVIWVTNDYSEETDFAQWYSYDKTKTYTYSNKTHAVVLVGYDKDSYYIADPLKEEVTKVDKKILEASYDSLGRQAVTLYNRMEKE